MPGEWGIRLVAFGGRPLGTWLREFDPDAGPLPHPTGFADDTSDPALALRFDSAADALAFAQTQSTRTPLRPDGQPNRPLTAFTVAIERLP